MVYNEAPAFTNKRLLWPDFIPYVRKAYPTRPIMTVGNRPWHAGLQAQAAESQRLALPEGASNGVICLDILFSFFRKVEAGAYRMARDRPEGFGQAAWSLFSQVMNDRSTSIQGPEDEPLILDWDPAIHLKLLARGATQETIALEKLANRYSASGRLTLPTLPE